MNWNMFWKALLHAAIGGAAVAGTQIAQNPATPFTSGNVLLPIVASAATSVISLLAQSPLATPPPAAPNPNFPSTK